MFTVENGFCMSCISTKSIVLFGHFCNLSQTHVFTHVRTHQCFQRRIILIALANKTPLFLQHIHSPISSFHHCPQCRFARKLFGNLFVAFLPFANLSFEMSPHIQKIAPRTIVVWLHNVVFKPKGWFDVS